MNGIRFRRGTFQWFRATRRIFLGFIGDEGAYLDKDDEVEFDGVTMKVGGEVHSAPKLKGAIKAGWLIPSEWDEYETPANAPGGVMMRPSTNRDGAPAMVTTSSDEEKMVGDWRQVREAGSNAKVSRDANAVEARSLSDAGSGSDGQVVGKLGSSVHDRVALNSRQHRQAVEETQRRQAPRYNYNEVRAGDRVEDLLPGIASSAQNYPPPHVSHPNRLPVADHTVEANYPKAPTLKTARRAPRRQAPVSPRRQPAPVTPAPESSDGDSIGFYED